MRHNSYSILTGQTQSHLVPCWSGYLVHQDVLPALERLRDKAASAGFELAIASSFRGFERQQAIWRDKVAGRRPVLAADGTRLEPEQLSREELLWSILRWSALPGTSRHHWGTDLDVYDAAAVDADYQLQLVPEEYAEGGPFAAFSRWLNDAIAEGSGEGFFHPYERDRGAVAPEPWHISYRPLADEFLSEFSLSVFEHLLHAGAWPLADEIAPHAEDIYRRYVALNLAAGPQR